ncbi:hypothetical protein V1527DRAFT_416090, partial [Lipomyces starkeyi]
NGSASRDVGAIRHKFNSLVNFPKSTGDPTCPPDIKRAKEISLMINESVEMADLYDTDINDEGADQQEESNSSTGSGHSPESSRSSDSSRAGSEAPPVAKRGTVASEVPLSRKKNNEGVTDSLPSDFELREERDYKYDIIRLYQIEHLRQALRDSKEDCRDWRQKVEGIQFQRERTDLVAERDMALQKVMVLELLNAKS